MRRKITIDDKEHYIERNTIRIDGKKIMADGRVLKDEMEGEIVIRSEDGNPISILVDRVVINIDSLASQRKIVKADDLTIDPNDYIVLKNEEKIILCKKEFEILYLLASHKGRTYTRQEILNNVWGSSAFVVSRTVDVHARRIRAKIGENYISTIKGIGYKFD